MPIDMPSLEKPKNNLYSISLFFAGGEGDENSVKSLWVSSKPPTEAWIILLNSTLFNLKLACQPLVAPNVCSQFHQVTQCGVANGTADERQFYLKAVVRSREGTSWRE